MSKQRMVKALVWVRLYHLLVPVYSGHGATIPIQEYTWIKPWRYNREGDTTLSSLWDFYLFVLT